MTHPQLYTRLRKKINWCIRRQHQKMILSTRGKNSDRITRKKKLFFEDNESQQISQIKRN